MINKKVASIFLLLLCFAIYDSLIKSIGGFPVNLVIFFYCSIYMFVVFMIYTIEVRSKFDKKVLMILSLPFLLRIVLNLLAIGKTRHEYNDLVSNAYIDYVSWMTLSVLIILVLWQRFIQ